MNDKIKNELGKIIKNYKEKNTEEYIHYLKDFLFFIGQNLLKVKFKENKTIINKIDFKESDNLSKQDKKHIKNILEELRYDISSFSLGELYESFITSKEKKYLGQVYTPNYIVKDMINKSITAKKLIDNPYFKIIDPCCGGGYFLINAFEKIKNIIKNNYQEIIRNNPKCIDELENIDDFILENNIYGTDLDDFAVYMTKVSLLLKSDEKNISKINIFKKDILLHDKLTLFNINSQKTDEIENENFDLVIGNPPYIGHKKIKKSYRVQLKNYYQNVFSNKADLSYCFFKRGYELLKDKGSLVYITSRYFLEAPSANGLRKFITENFNIDELTDFYGKKVFKGIGVSPTIIKCTKGIQNNTKIKVSRLNTNKTNVKDNNFLNFNIDKRILSDSGWLLLNDEEYKLYKKIEKVSDYFLKEVSVCNQGIITGCDKAFIIDKEMIDNKGLKEDIIKPWVKNSNVRQYKKAEIKKFILYTDAIEKIENYNNIIEHIKPFKQRLEKRRECKKGLRKWYQLQWGRSLNLFKSPKIIFPYKSSENRFTIDYENVLCSADVYILKLIDNDLLTIEYLLAYLNSKVFEFYFKKVAKKVGEKQYEYYPNKIMNLKIKLSDKQEEISKKVIKLLYLNDVLEKYDNGNNKFNKEKKHTLQEIKTIKRSINEIFYNIYNLSDKERNIVEEFCE
ncbi:MAG: adenine-specific DNA methylase [Firmicutes bacterium]|nr:adenine-specific DNA methylase [Bacillota bacterium]